MLSQEYQDWMMQMLDKLKQQQFAYLIERKTNNKNYFLYDVKGFNPLLKDAIVWTPFQRQAALFDSEEQVEEFQMNYISPRKSSIIRIVRPPAMIIMLHG